MDRLSNRPLLDNRLDNELYVPRKDATAAVDRAVRNGWNAVVTGPRGSGKTTFLRAWAYANRHDRAQVVPTSDVDRLTLLSAVFVPASGATDAAALLGAVIGSLIRSGHGSAEGPLSGSIASSVPYSSDQQPGDAARSSSLVDRLRNLIETVDDPLVLLVDDVDPVAGHQLFGVLRDELWTVPVQWIVSVDSSKAPELLQPPADAFFEATVILSPLNAAEATDLLKRRINTPFHLDLSEVFPDGVLPRDLLKLAQNEVATYGGGFRAAIAAHAQREDAITRLGAPALALAQVMNDLGPVSPSDARLLAQLRWTRSRVSQVMKQLAEAGLVEHTTATSSGPGRPARLYRLVTPEAFLSKQVVLQ